MVNTYNKRMSVLNFGQIQVSSKDFNGAPYQVVKNIDIDKVTLSNGIPANKNDMRYVIGYEVEQGKIIPLHIKTPKNCSSSGVRRYNKNSAWKMGFDVSEDQAWIDQYKRVCERVEELLFYNLSGSPLNNGKYINPKLLTWNNEVKTRFVNGWHPRPEDIKHCYASGVLKIGSVYQQGCNYHLQVFLKECRTKEKEVVTFQSQLSDSSDDEGYVTV